MLGLSESKSKSRAGGRKGRVMKYKNEKLQITIESAELFEIVERPNHIELIADGVTRFHVFAESSVEAFGSSTVRTFGSSTVEAYDSSTVRAYDSSTVVAHDSSSVVAYDSSSVEAYDSSTVVAHGFYCGFVKSGNIRCRHASGSAVSRKGEV